MFIQARLGTWQTRCYGFNHLFGERRLNVTASDAVNSWVVDAGGWQFVTHQAHVRRPGGTPKFKPGWVSSTVGDKMRVQIDTRDSFADPLPAAVGDSLGSHGAHTCTVDLMYLQSYAHMGTARASCVANCECTPIDVDAHDGREQVSVTRVVALYPVTQHARCVIELEILPSLHQTGNTSSNLWVCLSK